MNIRRSLRYTSTHNHTFCRVLILLFLVVFTSSCADRYKEGHSDGYSAGRQSGYKEGFVAGEKNGYIKGKKEGISEGYMDGTKIFIEESIFPTLGTTILIIASLIVATIVIVSFSIHFNKSIREIFNEIFLRISSVYSFAKLKQRNYFLKRVLKKRAKTQAGIYSFDLYNDICALTDEMELGGELLVIQATTESYLSEKLLESFLNKPNRVNEKIEDILRSDYVTINDRNKLLDDIYIILNRDISYQLELHKMEREKYNKLSGKIRSYATMKNQPAKFKKTLFLTIITATLFFFLSI